LRTGKSELGGIVTAVLFKVYCYRGTDKQIWFEVEDLSTGQGVAWSPSRKTALDKAFKLGYEVRADDSPVLKFYRAKAS
jgi:hypothetical protein